MSDSVSTLHTSETKSSAGAGKLKDFSPKLRLSDAVIAYTILRLSFGANIMLHGVSRLLAGHAVFVAYLNHYFEHTRMIPSSFLPAFATVLPPVETALGLLLFLGLVTRFSLIAGSLVLTALVIGTNLAQDWNVAGLQLIYCFIYYYLLVHRGDGNLLSLDAWRQAAKTR
jgi:thiosulfate dehydrogenase (quinone) large subunit